MKILITTDWYKTAANGVAVSVENLENGLIKDGHSVKVVTLSNNIISHKEKNTIYVGSVSAGKIYPYARLRLRSRNRYIKELENWKPDIIHSQCEFSTFRIARRIARAVNAPIVHTYHTLYEDYTHYISPSERIGKYFVKKLTNHVANVVNAFIVPSAKIKDKLCIYGCRVPVYVMPTGLNIKAIKSSLTLSQKEEFKSRLGIPEKNKVLLYLGRFAKEKNTEMIIEYLSRNKTENITFLMVGDGPYRHHIEECIEKYNLSKNTIMTGMVSKKEVKDYYAVSDAFVNASESETQGLTYFEALANDLPILCRKDECLKDILINGKNGFEFTNEEEFSESLEKILKFDKTQIKPYASELIEKNYSEEVFIRGVCDIYKKVLEHNT